METQGLKNQHITKVRRVKDRLSELKSLNKEIHVYHGTTNSTRSQKFKKENLIDVSDFDRVISVDEKNKFALVEPNVPMDKLVDETLQVGLIPPVVPEFPGITIGGGVQGGAEESSSFKYGMVHDCCLEYEMVLGNGEIVNASPTENSDLFYGTAASYGSMGILTKVKLKLVEAKKYVLLTYTRVNSFDEVVGMVGEKSFVAVQEQSAGDKDELNKKFDFIDAIMFSNDFGVVMTGKLVDGENSKISTFSKPSDEWFYLHAKKIVKTSTKYQELIPLKDYLFRYDRGAFWMGIYGFKRFKIPHNKITRIFMDPFMDTRSLYRILHETNLSFSFFIQDFNLSSEKAVEFLEYTDTEAGIYPIWICPLKPGSKDKLSANCIDTDLVFNIGIWGQVEDENRLMGMNRAFEVKALESKARKMLYAHSYYTPEEFWQVYDLDWYNSVRKKYHAEGVFPSIYDKTAVKERLRPKVAKGILAFFKAPKKTPFS